MILTAWLMFEDEYAHLGYCDLVVSHIRMLPKMLTLLVGNFILLQHRMIGKCEKWMTLRENKTCSELNPQGLEGYAFNST